VVQNSAPTTYCVFRCLSSDGTHLVAVDNGAGIYTSKNSGVTWVAQTSAPNAGWVSVASSSDGAHLVALDNGGHIYTNGLSGAQGTTATLQYLGNGQWQQVQAIGAWLANGTSLFYNTGYVGIGTNTPGNPSKWVAARIAALPAYGPTSRIANVKENFTTIAPGDVLDR